MKTIQTLMGVYSLKSISKIILFALCANKKKYKIFQAQTVNAVTQVYQKKFVLR